MVNLHLIKPLLVIYELQEKSWSESWLSTAGCRIGENFGVLLLEELLQDVLVIECEGKCVPYSLKIIPFSRSRIITCNYLGIDINLYGVHY